MEYVYPVNAFMSVDLVPETEGGKQLRLENTTELTFGRNHKKQKPHLKRNKMAVEHMTFHSEAHRKGKKISKKQTYSDNKGNVFKISSRILRNFKNMG